MATVDTHSPVLGLSSTVFLPLKSVAQAIEWIRGCNRMAADYERMSHKTDAQLAKDGLQRLAIPHEIVRRSELF
ncbi:hypothetical protein [Tropicimonas marinistellae]|uniref:hypothetical protein n=1 Tax=Tropicimonas marinistellae TaxID=1739787 RepID=UPI000830FB1D|nr:hypothetical protein [Tropicimonas marinistellae]